jgi:DNA-binding NarL/FixJ family response regulator
MLSVTLRCLIVDDDPNFIALARQVLDGDGGVTVVGGAANGAEAIELLQELDPDVVLVDVRLGEESGVALARLIAGSDGSSRVVLISTYSESDLAGVLPEEETIGFVSKVDLSASALRAAISER